MKLNDFKTFLQTQTKNHLGYPYNLQPTFSAILPFLEYSINNLGDPFVTSNYAIHSRNYERLTLEWFARVWGFKNYWGYVTSCGTEGNLHSLYVGRENLGERCHLLTSDQSHYSILKGARMFKVPVSVLPTNSRGEMNLDYLKKAIDSYKPTNRLLININIGSTVKGATDDLEQIVQLMRTSGIPRDHYYIHCDAALFGLMLPFTDPVATKQLQYVDAIATSGHKFLGTPFPCGVLMMQKPRIEILEKNNVEYLNSIDTTMMGSRNGHAPLFMWYRIKTHRLEGFREDVKACVEKAKYLRDLLIFKGIEEVYLNDKSNIVYFRRPKSETFIKKWQLACERDIAHVVVMPNISQERLREFVNEMDA